MSTVAQLIKRLEFYIDDAITTTDEINTAIDLFNECQEDLSEVAGYEKTYSISFTQGQDTFTLPDDLLDVADIQKDGVLIYSRRSSLKDEGTTDYPVYEWFGNTLQLYPAANKSGTLAVRYYAKLPDLVDQNSTPSLRSRFHRLLPLFAAARYAQNWKNKLDEKQDFMSEYLQGKADLSVDTEKRKSRFRQKSVYVVRSWR